MRRRRCCMRSARRSLLLEGLALGGLVVAQVLLFGRLVGADTDYDEGVYLTSLDALEHGQKLGEDVFAPQPPGWYLLLRLISLAGADSVRGFHIGMVVVAIATCLAAYLLGRSLAGPVAGLTAAALLTVAPPVPALRPPGAGRHPAARGVPARSLARLGGDRTPLRRGGSGCRCRVCTRTRLEADRRARVPVVPHPAPVGAFGATARRSLGARGRRSRRRDVLRRLPRRDRTALGQRRHLPPGRARHAGSRRQHA